MRDFVAIDFETANAFRGSACQVGLTKVVDGRVVDSLESLIFQNEFDPFNTMLHGISATTVKNAPAFDELLPTIETFIGDSPLLAHNAGFDMRVFYDSSLGNFNSDLTYFCSLVMSRQMLDLPSFSLESVCANLGIDFTHTYNALQDSRAAAEVALRFLEIKEVNSLDELAHELRIVPGHLTAAGPSGSHHLGRSNKLSEKDRLEILSKIPESELYEDPDFAGKQIVFTGKLFSMTRAEAQLKVMRAGGVAKDSVGNKTAMLVFGYQDPRVLKDGDQDSGKKQEVIKRRLAGQEIEMCDEVQFLEMLAAPEGL